MPFPDQPQGVVPLMQPSCVTSTLVFCLSSGTAQLGKAMVET